MYQLIASRLSTARHLPLSHTDDPGRRRRRRKGERNDADGGGAVDVGIGDFLYPRIPQVGMDASNRNCLIKRDIF